MAANFVHWLYFLTGVYCAVCVACYLLRSGQP
jgi:hypothetical protein